MTHAGSEENLTAANRCPGAFLVVGSCDQHSHNRYRKVPCGRRSCEVCGPIGRRRIAERIACGVYQFERCAWIVLTFKDIKAEKPTWKKEAVKRLGVFVRALRRELGIRLEYASTFELTKRRRLHINLIIGPWTFISQKKLSALWGARIWVEWVKNRHGMGREAAKSHDPRSLGGYVSKLEQAVPVEWGKRCSFSRGWPKLPIGGLPRVGSVFWHYADAGSWKIFQVAESAGDLIQVEPGEWAWRNEECGCFARASP